MAVIVKSHDFMCEILFLIYLLSVASGVNDSTGDVGQMSTTAKPPLFCFRRISTGERLIAYDVTRIVERSNVIGCEQECNIYKCTFFSFSGDLRGNGSCELTTDRQISRRQDPSFDLYERTSECVQGKPTGYEEACYRRIFAGRRLTERFIRHSLPCNSLEACQHQCSIEKHFDCQGFNIRLDPARVGRGICELSSSNAAYFDLGKDFVFDPEFSYYEKVFDNESPNCGYFSHHSNFSPYPNTGPDGRESSRNGGPYYGGDSYGPWSTGYGTVNHGPWGTHGYGSGFYVSNNPTRGPSPSFQPNTPFLPTYSYGYNGGRPYPASNPNYDDNKLPPSWNYGPIAERKFPSEPERKRPNRIPTYIIIDADLNDRRYENNQNNLQSYGPKPDLLPPKEKSYPSTSHNLTPTSQYLPPSSRNSPSMSPTTPTTPLTDPPQSKTVPTKAPSHHSGTKPEHEPHPTGRQEGQLPHQQNIPPTPQVHPVKPDDLPHTPHSHPYPVPPPRPPPPPFHPHYHSKGRQQPPSHSYYGPSAYAPHGSTDAAHGFSPISGHEVCFQRAHPGFRLNSGITREMHDTPTVLECEAMCTRSSFKCTGYSFRYSTSRDNIPNCLLTDFNSLLATQESHMLPDRSCDVYLKMGTCLDLERTGDTECFLKVARNRKLDTTKIVKSVSVRGISDCELACLSSNVFTCRSFGFRHGPGVIGEPIDNCFLSDWPISALSLQDYVLASGHEIYERGSFGHGCEVDVSPNVIGPGPPFTDYPLITHDKGSWNADETWRHFTVSGWPCKLGSECQLEPNAGFWSCEVEGSSPDFRQWDYCCRPKHSCGYSRGYNYPWCYVGEVGPEQWRPCSEQYYPEFGNRFPNKPAHGYNSHPADSYGPPRDARPWNFGDDFGPPEYWPISYLHTEAPPNETYVWDEDDHYHHIGHHHEEYASLEHDHHEHNDDSPAIKFKPCRHKFPYPKAIVQKLDLHNASKANDPEQQMLSEKLKELKKSENSDQIPSSDVALGFSLENQIKGDLRDNINFFPASPHPFANKTDEVFPGKRDLHDNSKSKSKSKEVIKTVEKIIEHSSTESNVKTQVNGEQ